MGAHASAKHPSSETSSAGTRTGVGPSSLAECFLCQAWAVLLDSCPCTGSSILSEVRPPTKEPDTGDPPVRFGGRGNPLRFSLPLLESITMIPRDNNPHPGLLEKMPGLYMVMGNTAEVVAKRYRVSRESQDEYSLLSQQRTARAQQEDFFDAEIAPMRVTRGVLDKRSGELVGKEEATVNRDECNRPDTTLQGLLNLRPHFDPGS